MRRRKGGGVASGRKRSKRLLTLRDTSWSASSSKAFSLFSLDVMICCSCLKVYGWKDIRVKPCSHMTRVTTATTEDGATTTRSP